MERRVSLGLAAVAGMAFAFVANRGLTPTPVPTADSPSSAGLNVPREAGPFVDGKKVTLDDAIKEFPLKLYRPDAPLANDSTIKAVYFEFVPAGGDLTSPLSRVAIDYQSGIIFTVETPRGSMASDPEGTFADVVRTTAEFAKDSKVMPFVDMSLGVPALTIPRSSQGPASVEFVLEGVQVTLIGKYAPLDVEAILEVAQSTG